MLNLILFIVIIVMLIAMVYNLKTENFSQCSGVSINKPTTPSANNPLVEYNSNQSQDKLLDIINKSINDGINGAFDAKSMSCNKIPSNYIPKNSIPPLADCPSCVCPKVVINSSELQECKADCPKVEPCPDKICPRPDPVTCPDNECTYMGIKGLDSPDELFKVISDMLKNNQCTKQTLVAGINQIFANQSESP